MWLVDINRQSTCVLVFLCVNVCMSEDVFGVTVGMSEGVSMCVHCGEVMFYLRDCECVCGVRCV